MTTGTTMAWRAQSKFSVFERQNGTPTLCKGTLNLEQHPLNCVGPNTQGHSPSRFCKCVSPSFWLSSPCSLSSGSLWGQMWSAMHVTERVRGHRVSLGSPRLPVKRSLWVSHGLGGRCPERLCDSRAPGPRKHLLKREACEGTRNIPTDDPSPSPPAGD